MSIVTASGLGVVTAVVTYCVLAAISDLSGIDPSELDRARGILEGSGYTDLVLSTDANVCGVATGTCTAFTATSPDHRRVAGAIECSGGCRTTCVVRFDGR